MAVTALIMAGGKSMRMKLPEEKPMICVAGVPMIERIVNCLKNVKKIGRIVVATTLHTRKTSEKAKLLGVEVFETPGVDYVSDVKYAIQELQLKTVLIVSADLPLLTSETVNHILEQFETCGKPSLAVTVHLETCKRLGANPELSLTVGGETLCPAGVNMILGEKIGEPEIEQALLVLDRPELAVNVNTINELIIAERHLSKTHVKNPPKAS